MEPKQRRILRRLRLELADQLRVEQLVQYLYQERVVSQNFLEELEAEPVSVRRTLKLLDYLPGRGPRAFAAFIESLRDEFPWLCRRLEEEEERAEDEPEPPEDDVQSTISEDILNSVPTDKQLNRLSSQLGAEWERAVVDLGLKSSDIYRCKMNHQYNVQAQILSAFLLWKQRLGKRATVRNLCSSLISAEVDRIVISSAFQ
ncbi:death domain-containing protein CRADD isoform X1 [Hypanus sabinus]|uniref:death domain-containing protein CRADD isoform X1 n=1 Tax=Hypanus sabinus TaxID=79690 RepID=UPI0028C456A8|nr:death domain-containing protein CRADD isoform X1 [Hypanus sabinus]